MIEKINDYLASGLSVIPVRLDDKRPVVKWKKYQESLPSESELKSWFKKSDNVVAVVCGKVSGNLELIDIDNHFADAEKIYLDFKELVEGTAPDLFEKLVVETTQSGGYHLVYRCESMEGNLKLAKRWKSDKQQDTVIETRGEGGYALVDPSPGYKLIQGQLNKLSIITELEREIMFAVAKTFNEVEETNQQNVRNNVEYESGEEMPGADFNARGDIRQTLISNGWFLIAVHNQKELWRRPGKNKGISATFNANSGNLKDRFYVFSSNAYPFDSGRSYSKFAVEAILKYNSDFSAAAKDLAKLGYGKKLNGNSNGVTHKGFGGKKSKKSVTPDGTIVEEDDGEVYWLPDHCVFWSETVVGRKNPVYKLVISKSKLINFLIFHGYAKFWVDKQVSISVQITDNMVTEETPETIVDFLKDSILSFEEIISDHFTKNQLWESVLQKINQFRAKEFLDTLPAIDIQFIKDDKENAFFFFKNYVIKANKYKATILQYNTLEGYIWKNQIINHELKLIDEEMASDTGFSLFGRFLEKICSPNSNTLNKKDRKIDDDRLSSLCSAIGYLLHTYKNPSIVKAVIFCEEKIAKDDESNGRTGKGLTAYALAKMRNRVAFNGKQVDFSDKFLFQKISPDTQLIYFDDVKKRFDFEGLFSVLTEGLTIEKKGQKPIDLPFEKTPKILISTNSVLSNDTDSFRARKHEIEFSDYFSADYTPFDEFNSNFFEQGWEEDNEEWDKFYSFMIYCTVHYLKNGLLNYNQKNLAERKLLANVPEDFLETAEIFEDKIRLGEKVLKEELFDAFVSKNKIYGQNGRYAITQKTTSKWFAFYLNFKNINFVESKNSKRDDRRKFWQLAEAFNSEETLTSSNSEGKDVLF